MPNLRLFAIPIIAAMLLGGGCRSGDIVCSLEARASLLVTVVDKADTPMCGASVTVQDGGFSQKLRAAGDFHGARPDDCTYFGPTERKGTYAITARLGTQHTTIDDVKVSADECHVHTRSVTIHLDR